MFDLGTKDEYLGHCQLERGLSPHSVRAYRQDLDDFERWYRGTEGDVVSASECISRYLDYLRHKRLASASTVRRRIVTFKAFVVWLAKRNHEPAPNFAEINLSLRIPKRLPRPVDRPTIVSLLAQEYLSDVRGSETVSRRKGELIQTTTLAIRLLVATGLRIGELTQLRIEDVSTCAQRIRVRGKGNRERCVYVVNERLIVDLSRLVAARRSAADATPFIFINVHGKRLTEATFRKRLKRLASDRRLGTRVTPHQFRHSAATFLIEEGVDIRLVQRLLGHASIATTEIYTRVSDVTLVSAMRSADVLSTIGSEER